MNPEHEQLINCPYCGETIALMIDCSYLSQSTDHHYIEDCHVCCRPINLHISYADDNSIQVRAAHENE